MKSRIYQIELSDDDAFAVANLFTAGLLQDKPELVAHRDEFGVIWQCGPAKEGYHIEPHTDLGQVYYYLLPDGKTMTEDAKDLGFGKEPPDGCFVWSRGEWKAAHSWEQTAREEEEMTRLEQEWSEGECLRDDPNMFPDRY